MPHQRLNLIKCGNARPDPHFSLFRNQLKGLLEDVDLLLAFDSSNKNGWIKLMLILSHQQPRSESELVAILARKIEVLGLTQVHQNFLNPTLNLRLHNFINWVGSAYLMSPNYSNSPPERSFLARLAWLLEQLVALKMMDTEGGVDAFLTEEARSGYDIFSLYLVDMGRLFEIEWSAADRAGVH